MGLPLRLLLIEDSEDDALLLARELRHGGYDPSFKRVKNFADMEAVIVAFNGFLGQSLPESLVSEFCQTPA